MWGCMMGSLVNMKAKLGCKKVMSVSTRVMLENRMGLWGSRKGKWENKMDWWASS